MLYLLFSKKYNFTPVATSYNFFLNFLNKTKTVIFKFKIKNIFDINSPFYLFYSIKKVMVIIKN